jgi:hypothetical protein
MEWATNRLGCGTAEEAVDVLPFAKIKEYVIQFNVTETKSKASKEYIPLIWTKCPYNK